MMPEQFRHFVERESERFHSANDEQPLEIRLGIETEAALGAP